MLDNHGGDGRERTFSWPDIIGRRRNVAKGVGGPGDGKIVHFVVHDDAGFWNQQMGPEKKVDGGCKADGHSRGIGSHDVRCPRSAGISASFTRHSTDSRVETFKSSGVIARDRKRLGI